MLAVTQSNRRVADSALSTSGTTIEVGCLLLLLATIGVGCAKVEVKPGIGNGGSGGSGPVVTMMPAIPNLASLAVSPASQTITLGPDGTGGYVARTSTPYAAQGILIDGSSSDVTAKVNWSLDPRTGSVVFGNATVSSPGIYRVIVTSGSITASAELVVNFTGNTFGTGFNMADASKLDGAASGSVNVDYPLDGAIFPSNFGAVTFHIRKTGAQDIARLNFSGDGLSNVNHYGVCESGPPGGGCYVTLPSAVTKLFLAASAQRDVTVTARLGSVAGGAIAESAGLKVAWANVPLSGGLYYWTTINPGAVPGYSPPDPADPRGTAVMRYNFGGDDPKRELVWTDRGSPRSTPAFQESPPAQPGTDPQSGRVWGEGRCIGCHAISPNGKLMAFSIGGSDASSWAILNIESVTLNELDPAASMSPLPGLDALKRYRKGNFATFTTFGPASDLMVNMYRGKLTMRAVNTSLAMVRDDLFAAATTERKSDPFWSPDGAHFAFTSYDVNQGTQDSKYNGDTKTGGQIWTATADPTGPHEDAKVIVPRQAGLTSYYPAISHDGALLVFNKSSCSGLMNPGGYGTAPCDGYDDITASLWLTNTSGTTPVELLKANGGTGNSNSWPRWSPDNGYFRGQKLYWVAFSSRRPYGLQVNAAAANAKPQLWFSAIVLGGEFQGGEPSHAPVWMPKQNLDETNNNPTGNHVPQWVKFVVPIP